MSLASLVPPFKAGGICHSTSAALQFAVCGLEVEHIIVLGHARCGEVKALLETPQEAFTDENFITSWMSIAETTRKQVLARTDLPTFEALAHACELGTKEASLTNLQTFPWISEAMKHGKLQLHGWYYDLEAGNLLRFDSAKKTFRPLS